MVTDMCRSCRHCKESVVTGYAPIYAGAYQTREVQRLTKWCSLKGTYIRKIQARTDCGYKPKSGRVNRRVRQMQL